VPERDSDLLYACRFSCADPIAWFEHRGASALLVNDLDTPGARRAARVDAVLPLSECFASLQERGIARIDLPRALGEVLKARGARHVEVPAAFPAAGLAGLRRAGLHPVVAPEPFFATRAKKSAREIRWLRQALRATEAGLAQAHAVLAASRIGRGGYLYLGRERLTSEALRELSERAMFAAGATPERSIVAGGGQGADPHHRGAGPLRAHQPVVLDFFPRHRASGYYGDLTRTWVKGRADARTRKAFAAVAEAQRLAYRLIRHGASGPRIHELVCRFFEAAGYAARKHGKRREGFIHGTGHGLGLDLHEPPQITVRPSRLESGHVITIEPGLYYPGWGGIRIEDVVQVTPRGCRKLSRFPVFLEIP
jgi:Xaa-Pro aminopeptidase